MLTTLSQPDKTRGTRPKRFRPGTPRQAPPPPIVVVRRILASLGSGRRLVFTGDQFERFDITHWAPVSEQEMRGFILDVIEADGAYSPTMRLVNDVLQLLRTKTVTPIVIQYPDNPKSIINCSNGEIWLQPDGSFSLQPHNPESRQHHCLNLIYDHAAACPVYDKMILQIFGLSSHAEAVSQCWDEIVGQILHASRPEPRIIICRGGGGDGKTLLVRLIMRLLHSTVIASMPVEDLRGSRFVRGDLLGKQLFVDMDMTAGVTLPDGMLKLMSDGGQATAERKNRDPITFTLRAMPLLVGNNVPRLTDRSKGFKRRLCVMPFNRSFLPEEQNPHLFQHIAETEMSGVLNRALAGLQRLIRRGWKLDPPEDVRQATEAWWAEATGQASATASGARVSRTPEPEAECAGDVLSSGPTPAASPERSTVGRENASPMPVKVTVDLDPTAEQQRVEVITSPQSVMVRVGRPT